MHVNEKELVRAALKGSDEAAEDLFRIGWPEAIKVARTILGNSPFAEDVAQEAISKAFARLAAFDGRRPFAVWVRRIVVNGALNVVRDRKRLVPLTEDVAAREQPPPSGRGALSRAVENLRPERRILIALRYGADLTPPEIAEATGISVGTVKSRLARALEDLRSTLREESSVG